MPRRSKTLVGPASGNRDGSSLRSRRVFMLQDPMRIKYFPEVERKPMPEHDVIDGGRKIRIEHVNDHPVLKACYRDYEEFCWDGFRLLASQNPRMPPHDFVQLCNTEVTGWRTLVQIDGQYWLCVPSQNTIHYGGDTFAFQESQPGSGDGQVIFVSGGLFLSDAAGVLGCLLPGVQDSNMS
ncbi:unnamed protein product [Cladocopium goreaui]|uniref:Uncharacterized protein n=1 Tax=Cladocopium goreaui TaxID=2562237 RepID=A0A9P1CYC8_9DINO|nr:unnamed protein product [Cladocopium goreaui]